MGKKEKASKFGLIAMILGIVAVVVALFLPSVVVEVWGEQETVCNGLKAVIGSKEDGLAFSILALIPFLLCIVGAILATKADGIVAFITAGVFAVATVLFFLMPSLLAWTEEGELAAALLEDSFKLGIGAIIGAVCAAGAGVCTLLGALKK